MQIRDAARQAFLRFRDGGDPRALAEVFDLVAQQLLLVASHVAGRQQSPEDLLQETFLTAIQRADRYDRERPLEPWLVGILVNVTRNDRRRRQREASGEAVEPAPSEHGPSDAAIEAEFLASLDEAIAGLPVPQREVMTLHLVHGMTPTEIAHATSRPVGTVKSWIHRSRDFVRRRLPASLAASFGALLRGMDGLDSVRDVVVAAAGQHVASLTASSVGGVGSVSSRFVGGVPPSSTPGRLAWPLALAAGLVVTTGGLWFAARTAPDPAAVPAAPAAAPATVAIAPEVDPSPGTPGRVDAGTGVTPAERRTATVHFVGAFAGEPFAWQGLVMAMLRPDPFLWAVPVRAGAAGRHSVQGVPYGTYGVQADRAALQWFDVDGPEVTVAVAFAEGAERTGRVVDAEGRPVAGAIVATSVPSGLDLRLPVATSDAAGRFRVAALVPGSFLEARLPGMVPSGLWQVPANGAASVESPTFELRLGGVGSTVVVDVVDARGQPVPAALVQFGSVPPVTSGDASGSAPRMRLPFVARTDERGRVVCSELPMGRDVDLFVRAVDHAPLWHTLPAAAERHVRLELGIGATVRGEIAADGGDAAAMVRGVSNLPAGVRPPAWFWPNCRPDVVGRYELRGLPIGPVRLQARAMLGALLEHELVLAADSGAEWSPSFASTGTLAGVVRHADGRPFRDGVVGLHAAARAPRFAALDEHGAFSFVGLPELRHELTVQSRAEAGALVLLRTVAPTASREVALELPADRTPSAVLRGRLLRRAERRVGLLDHAFAGTLSAEVESDGSFAFLAPPGSYSVIAGEHQIVLRHDVALQAGAVLDLGGVDGALPCAVEVSAPDASQETPYEVHAYGAEGGPLFGLLVLREPRGRLMLPPGRYRLSLLRHAVLLDQRSIDVRTDGANEVAFVPSASGEALHVLAAPSELQLEWLVQWRIDGPHGRWFAQSRRPTDLPADQAASLRVWLPAGDHAVHAQRPRGAWVRTDVHLPRSADAEPPLLRLP